MRTDDVNLKSFGHVATKMPARYHWLLHTKTPLIIQEALNLYGTYELKGADHNPAILQWAKDLGSKVGIDYTEDEIPWCGLYVGICVKRAGFEPVNICVRAKEWLGFGVSVEAPALGDVLVFDRRGGGHVGFYVGEDDTAYHVLGGNQSNQVNIRRINKDRFIGARRLKYSIKPQSVKAIYLSSDGEVSENEA